MPHESGLTCLHQPQGLCPACQADYDYDPLAYHEYGDHPAGSKRWADLQAEMNAEPRGEQIPADDSIPF